MNSRTLIAASTLAAGLALAPFAQAEDLAQTFFVLYDDGSAASQETAAPAAEQPGPTDSGRELAELRAAIASDMDHE
jgi:hypothetical protein